MSDLSVAKGALARWIDALHGRGDREAIARALCPDICIERHAPAPRDALGQGEAIERIEGYDAVAVWLARTPEATVFSLQGDPWLEGELVATEYALEVEGFRNGGRWLARLDGGRLRWISHQPRAIET